MSKKRPFTNWKDVDQGRAFKKMHKTMDKEIDAATKDFETVGSTQDELFTPGKKITMGNIDPQAAAKERRKRR